MQEGVATAPRVNSVALFKSTMKKLSDTLKELNINFSFPLKIEDPKGNTTYYEDSNGNWSKREYDVDGNMTYYERSDGYWFKREYDAEGNMTYYERSNGNWAKYEYDADGNETYFERSNGSKRGTPRSAKTCEGKIVEVDGVKYELKAL